eukprot:207002-Hanusia_phi.AAC.1
MQRVPLVKHPARKSQQHEPPTAPETCPGIPPRARLTAAAVRAEEQEAGCAHSIGQDRAVDSSSSQLSLQLAAAA